MPPVKGLKADKQTLLINWFLMLLILSSGFISMVDSLNMTALFFTGASLLACLILVLRIEDPVLRIIILVALVVRVGLALIQAYTDINLPGSGADTLNFESYGWQNAQAWLYGNESGRIDGALYYSAWIGILYCFFGRILFIPQLFNIYFSLLTIFILYRTAYTVTASVRVSRIAVLFLAVLPSINAFSAILLRETMIYFFAFFLLFNQMDEAGADSLFGVVIPDPGCGWYDARGDYSIALGPSVNDLFFQPAGKKVQTYAVAVTSGWGDCSYSLYAFGRIYKL